MLGVVGHILVAVLCSTIASAQVFQESESPAECLWTGEVCGVVATGPDAALYHQVTENFEACFSSTVVNGEYVQRYSGCSEIPDNATCETFFSVPLSLCLPNTATWETVTDLQNVLRLMIECQDGSVVSTRECDSFRADLYNGLQCPQCVAPANAVAAASVVCGTIDTEAQCVPEAADMADFQDYSHLDPPVAPAPALVLLQEGWQEDLDDYAPLAVDLPGGGLDGVFPAGVPIGALVPESADGFEFADVPAGADMDNLGGEVDGQEEGPEASAAHHSIRTLPAAVGASIVIILEMLLSSTER